MTFITGYALWIAVSLNGQIYEAIPNVYKSEEDCVKAEQVYTKDVVLESRCFHGTFKVNNKGEL